MLVVVVVDDSGGVAVDLVDDGEPVATDLMFNRMSASWCFSISVADVMAEIVSDMTVKTQEHWNRGLVEPLALAMGPKGAEDAFLNSNSQINLVGRC